MRDYGWLCAIVGFFGAALGSALLIPELVTPRWVVGQLLGFTVLLAILTGIHVLALTLRRLIRKQGQK